MVKRAPWFIAFSLAAALHAAAWQHFSGLNSRFVPPQSWPTVEVTLSAPTFQPKAVEALNALPPPAAIARPLPTVEPSLQPLAASPQQAASAAPAAIAAAVAAATPPVSAVPTEVREAVPSAAAVIEPPRFNAAYLDNPPPAYPLAARRRSIEGKVLVRAEVQHDGRCSQALLKQSSGYDMLDQAALAAVKNWRFIPAKQGERNMVAWVDVPIVFKLQD